MAEAAFRQAWAWRRGLAVSEFHEYIDEQTNEGRRPIFGEGWRNILFDPWVMRDRE